MTSDEYFRGASGTRYAYADIADRIRKEAPHTLGKHIFVQLAAIGLLEEMQNGTTPCGLPFTFAGETATEAAAPHTPGTWYVDGLADDETQLWIRTIDRPIANIRIGRYPDDDKANARRIVAAVNACEGFSTRAARRWCPPGDAEAIGRLAYDAGGDQNNPLIRQKTLESADRALAVIAKATAA